MLCKFNKIQKNKGKSEKDFSNSNSESEVDFLNISNSQSKFYSLLVYYLTIKKIKMSWNGLYNSQ